MVIDTSACIAILLAEPEAESFARIMSRAESRRMSAANVLEASIIIETRKGPNAAYDLDLFIAKAGIQILAVTPEQTEIAREAYRQFGKGRGAASLNFGDCFAYAAAKQLGEPLLFKGQDFAQTDILRAE